jgi:5-methylcytosine-specific restriction endonuclease McrA
MNEQHRYWKENPEAKKEHDRQWGQAKWWLEYQTRPERRLYIRQKSKRRKALLREQTAHQIRPRELRARFVLFGNCCAYCGASGDMEIEHVIAISKGGTHAMGNIVPACHDCNSSKRAKEPETWYRQQPFFTECRWRKICRVLGWQRSSVGQLALL